MLKALIFDIDGTVAETEMLHLRAFNLAFEFLNLGFVWSKAEYKMLLDVCGGKERIAHYFAMNNLEFRNEEILIAKIHAAKTKFYADLMCRGEMEFRPQIKALMLEAKSKNIKIAIATTTSAANLDALFAPIFTNDWRKMFASICDGDKIKEKKPNPKVYSQCLAELGLNPNQVLAFEDSQNGLCAANRAGIKTVITHNRFTFDQNFTDAIVCGGDLGDCAAQFSNGRTRIFNLAICNELLSAKELGKCHLQTA